MPYFVYASPDILPDVWTPPRCVIVLPLCEHPAIIAENVIERLPKEDRKRPLTERTRMIISYLLSHPRTDANTMAADLGLRWESVKSLLLANPQLFRRAGSVRQLHGGASRTLWALVES